MTYQRTNSQSLFFLLFGAAVYLYVNLFYSARVPFLLNGDQLYFWMYAQRMLGGARVYQDFFQYTPPGTDFVYLSFFKLFGPYVWVTNVIVLALGVALTWICFSVASEIMQRRSALLASGVLTPSTSASLLARTGNEAQKEKVRQSQEDAKASRHTSEEFCAEENGLSFA